MNSVHHGFTYIWSNHANERWSERFKGIDRHIEFGSSRRLTKKQKKLVKILTPVNAERYMRQFNNRYLLKGKSNIIFVVSDSSIVTVFHLYGIEE